MVQRMALVVVCLLAGCVDSQSVVCGPLVCSEASVCAPSGDRCVQPQQLDICAGQADGAGCSFPGVSAGSCSKEICEPIGCGNGVVEVDLAEVCDDGNRISGAAPVPFDLTDVWGHAAGSLVVVGENGTILF